MRRDPLNPSRWSERLVLAAFALVGLAISLYLAAYQLGFVAAPWDPFFGPESSARVLHSAFSRALPIPDALLGAVAYALEVATDLAGGAERWRTHPTVVLAFGAVAAGLGVVSVGLIVLQAFVVHHGCALCLASAAISIGIALRVAPGAELAAAWRVVSARRARHHAS